MARSEGISVSCHVGPTYLGSGLEPTIVIEVYLRALGFRVWFKALGFRVWFRGLGFRVWVRALGSGV